MLFMDFIRIQSVECRPYGQWNYSIETRDFENWWTQDESEIDAELFGRKWEEWRIHNQNNNNKWQPHTHTHTRHHLGQMADADRMCCFEEFRLNFIWSMTSGIKTSIKNIIISSFTSDDANRNRAMCHYPKLVGRRYCFPMLSDAIQTTQLYENTFVWSCWSLYFLTFSRTTEVAFEEAKER